MAEGTGTRRVFIGDREWGREWEAPYDPECVVCTSQRGLQIDDFLGSDLSLEDIRERLESQGDGAPSLSSLRAHVPHLARPHYEIRRAYETGTVAGVILDLVDRIGSGLVTSDPARDRPAARRVLRDLGAAIGARCGQFLRDGYGDGGYCSSPGYRQSKAERAARMEQATAELLAVPNASLAGQFQSVLETADLAVYTASVREALFDLLAVIKLRQDRWPEDD
jgi:hypothetical protein